MPRPADPLLRDERLDTIALISRAVVMSAVNVTSSPAMAFSCRAFRSSAAVSPEERAGQGDPV